MSAALDIRTLVLAFGVFALLGLVRSVFAQETPADGDPEPGISRDLARARRDLIDGVVDYDLALDLRRGADTYSGRCVVGLALKRKPKHLVLDFKGKSVESLSVDGEAVTDFRRVANHIVVPGARLPAGRRRIAIDFTSGIGRAGEGIIRVEDTDDDAEYLYTLNVPDDGHAVLPCFDQPDLKGRFTLTLATPDDWVAIGNGPRLQVLAEKDKKTWRFAATKPISSYLFAFAAGPFIEVKEKRDEAPIRVFGRRSQKKLLDAQGPEIVRLHRVSLDVLVPYFDSPYPFAKFDTVLVPDFPYGGMEHPGCIFYGEDRLLFRTAITRLDEAARASIIAHETAHMWFGDLVTMPWFDDVWLKEGFANLMAHKVLEETFEGVDHLAEFFLKYYPSALDSDTTRGAQAVRQPLDNLADAKSNYGPIIYRKGPAVLRQLEQKLGADVFRRGVRTLLKDHAFGCADWATLRRTLATAADPKKPNALDRWGEAWIESPGAPIVVARRARQDGEQRRLVLWQVAPDGSEGRWPLALAIVFHDGRGRRVGEAKATFDGTDEQTKEIVVDMPREATVAFANDRVHAYADFQLDSESLAHIVAILSRFRDVTLRAQLWDALWSHLQTGTLPPAAYLFNVRRLAFRETDPRLVRLILDRAAITVGRFLTGAERDRQAAVLAGLLKRRMNDPKTPSDLRLLAFRTLGDVIRRGYGDNGVDDIVSGKTKLSHLDIRLRDRWRLLKRLAQINHPATAALLKQLQDEDKSDDGRRQAFLVEAAHPATDAKKAMFNRFRTDRDLPERWIQNAVSGFFGSGDAKLRTEFLATALDDLAWIKANRKIFFLADWINAAVRSQTSPRAVGIVETFLARKDVSADVRRKVLVALAHLKRAEVVRGRTSGRDRGPDEDDGESNDRPNRLRDG